MLYGLPRPTVDVDFLSAPPIHETANLESLAGMGSALHNKHGVFVQHVGFVTVPDSYEDRLTPIFPSAYRRLRLLGLEAYDPALSKPAPNPTPGRSLLAVDGVVVGSDGGSGAGGAKVDHREHAVEFFGGVSTGNEVFDAHQTTLQSQFDQRTLPAEFAGGAREGGVQLVLAPGGLQIHGIGDRQGGETDFPEGLAGRRRCWGSEN